MKFHIRRTDEWRPWFAWHPVQVVNYWKWTRVGKVWVWMEHIERRWSVTFCGSEWEYRAALAKDGSQT